MNPRARTGPPVRTIVARLGLLAGLLLALLLALGGQPFRLGARPIATSGGQGYWLLAKDGGVFAYGDAAHHGNNLNPGNDIVALAPTPTLKGYWTADDDGTVFAYGDAVNHGSRVSEANDIGAFAARPQGDGYWLVTADGVVTARGAAGHHGNTPALGSGRKVVGMVSTPSGNGYWLVGRDGGIFAFGDAAFYGSTGAISLNQPIVGMTRAPSGNGYWFVASDGGVFAFGGAGFHGSTGSNPPASGIVGISPTPSGNGYLLVGGNGKVFAFGDAANYGDASTFSLAQPVIGIYATPVVHSNEVPAAVADSASVAEDDSVSIAVLLNDAGLGDGSISVSIVSGPAHGTASVAGNKINYSPVANYNGADSITYKVTDGDNESSTAVLSINVTAVNDAPAASNDTLSTDEDAAAGDTLGGSDIDGNSLTFSVVNQPAHGSVSISGGGYTYTPAANYHGPDSFTFRANDGSADSNTATVSVTVNPVPDAPVVQDASVSPNEDTLFSGTLSGFDADNDPLTFAIVAGPSHGVLTPGVDGAYTYLPGSDFNGSDSFTYRANDGTADSNTSTVTITVLAANDLPVITEGDGPLPIDVDEDDTVGETVTFTATDVDTGDTLTWSASDPAHGTVTAGAPGTFTYTPDADLDGTESFTVTVEDSGELTDTIRVDVTIVNKNNDAPVASVIGNKTMDEDGVLEIPLTVSDPDTGDELEITVASSDPSTSGALTVTGVGTERTLTIIPPANVNGSALIFVSVSDGEIPVLQDFLLTVTPVNDLPEADALPITTDEDTQTSGTLTGDDPVESSPLTFALDGDNGGAAHGTVTLEADGAYTYMPDANHNGPDAFSFVVNDGEDDSEPATVSINVTAVNDIPVADAGTLTSAEDAEGSGTLTGSDPVEESTVKFALNGANGGAAHGTVTITDEDTGAYTYEPAADYNGPDSFGFVVNDGAVDSLPATVSITVTPVNDAPVVSAIDARSVNEDEILEIDFSATDVDGDILTIHKGSSNLTLIPASGLTLSGADDNRTLTVDSAANLFGDAEIFLSVSDGTAPSILRLIPVTVSSVNDNPVITEGAGPVALPVDEDDSVGESVSFSATDIEDAAGALLWSASDPANGTVTAGPPGTFTYVPDADFDTSESFTVTVTDLNGGTDTIQVVVTIGNLNNDAPVFNAGGDSGSGDEETPITGSVSATDPDAGDTLTYSIEAGDEAASGLASINDTTGAWSYTGGLNFAGTDSFTITATDNGDGNLTHTLVVNVEVTNLNDAPVIDELLSDLSTSGTFGGGISGMMIATDADGDLLSWSVTAGPSAPDALASFNALPAPNGSFTYSSPSPFDNDSFTVTVSDGNGGFDTAVVTVTEITN